MWQIHAAYSSVLHTTCRALLLGRQAWGGHAAALPPLPAQLQEQGRACRAGCGAGYRAAAALEASGGTVLQWSMLLPTLFLLKRTRTIGKSQDTPPRPQYGRESV